MRAFLTACLCLLAVPLLVLYEGSIWSVWLIEKQRADAAKSSESAV